MNSPILALRVAAIVFALVCIAQLYRVLTHAEVMVNDHAVPLWLSVFAFIITGFLSFWTWRLSHQIAKTTHSH